MKYFKILAIVATVSTLLSFQNCSMVAPPMIEENKISSLSAMAVLESKAFSVVTNRCAGCHSDGAALGGIGYITDLDALLYYRKVIPGEPELSPLYNVIQSGSMPPGQPLTASEAKAIYDWIHDGLVATSVGVPPPAPPSTTLTATFSSINNNILKTKCLGCHSSATSSGGVSFSSYTSTMNTVQPGNPAASSLYTSINNGSMPKGSGKLSTAEIAAVQTWIQNNAPNN